MKYNDYHVKKLTPKLNIHQKICCLDKCYLPPCFNVWCVVFHLIAVIFIQFNILGHGKKVPR